MGQSSRMGIEEAKAKWSLLLGQPTNKQGETSSKRGRSNNKGDQLKVKSIKDYFTHTERDPDEKRGANPYKGERSLGTDYS